MKDVLIFMCIIPLTIFNVHAEEYYSPAMNYNYPSTVYWGDTHLHTNLSTDANGMGNRNLSPDDAYEFAKGRMVAAHNGQKAKLHRALDFLVVADHGANMGVMAGLAKKDPQLLSTIAGKRWYHEWKKVPIEVGAAGVINKSSLRHKSMSFEGDGGFFWRLTGGENPQVVSDRTFRYSVWNNIIQTADKHNDPGRFTAFSGYEWTSNTPAAIHRVVIFKDDHDRVSKVLPFTKYDSDRPEKLWAYMTNYELETGGQVLAIPHNSNLASGKMFSSKNSDGILISSEEAKIRSRWEPLVEVTQYKGDSETHPFLSPDDDFSDYETWNGWMGKELGKALTEKQKINLPNDYIRSSLKLGLQVKERIKINPFKFGLIGSTDSHSSFSAADENNFWGKMVQDNPNAERMDMQALPWAPESKNWEYAASGYAAVWAEENTRESLFAAMKRKEVYASTGPRITVRFFGGWDYEENDAFKPNLARIGYEKGVPMGGDLTSAPKDKSPTFLIRSVKDPDGANLDRVQVIKGWHHVNGELHEKVYNVALSDNRKDKGPKTKKVGNTVDIPNASYTNTIGDPELAVVWIDPDFDKDELAFYYVRVLEIPTPRWTAYDAKYFQLKNIPKDVPMITQERAYTSPIWYTPYEK